MEIERHPPQWLWLERASPLGTPLQGIHWEVEQEPRHPREYCIAPKFKEPFGGAKEAFLVTHLKGKEVEKRGTYSRGRRRTKS